MHAQEKIKLWDRGNLPQREFLRSSADIVFYGGAAGGGKSYGLMLDMVRHHQRPGFLGVIFRKTTPALEDLWAKSHEVFGLVNGHPREGAKLDWTWDQFNSRVLFRHMQHEKDKFSHQGQQYAVIHFDELTQFSESQFWYLVSRNRSTCGIKPYIRATCNPEPGWVADLISWWIGEDGYAIPERSGVVRYFARNPATDEIEWADTREELEERYPPLNAGGEPDRENGVTQVQSFTFILADLSDNKVLTKKDPTYRAKLLAMSKVERERLLGRAGKRGGNWHITDAAGVYFRSEWMRVITRQPTVVHWVRGWDKAATEPGPSNPDPDWTVGVRLGRTSDGRYVLDGRNIVRLRGSVRQVELAMRRAAEQDGIATHVALWQDPGQAGVVDREHTVRQMPRRTVRFEVAREKKTTYWGPVSSAMEHGQIDLLLPANGKMPSECRAFLNALENVVGNGKEHDDDPDALARAYLEIGQAPEYAYTPAKPDRSRFTL